MSIRLYDEAIITKIGNWIKDPNLTILGPEDSRLLFQYTADINDDKPIVLPLISITRDPTIDIRNPNKQVKTFDGAVIQANTNAVELLNAVPISINYQVNIYCRYQAEADEYVRNFIFNMINYRKIVVVLPYNDSEIQHESNITLSGSFTDNSDIPERLIRGQFTRYTIPFSIDDAYIFSVPIRKTIELQTVTNVKLSSDK